MPRRTRKPRGVTEAAIIAQANPTAEQRGRSIYVEDKTVDPFGETLVQGKVMQHRVCRRQPVYVTLHGRKGICDRTRAVLDWYDARLALARKGLTVDSLARANGLGGGNSKHTPTDAATNARSDVDWARSYIGNADELRVFDDVMEHERTFDEIAGGNSRKAKRASDEFKLAASWLLLGIGSQVLELRS